MSADLAARLRALAQDHHSGRLNLAAYRKLRAPLLDSLALHSMRATDDMAITQPRAVCRPGAAAAAGEPAAAQAKTTTGSNAHLRVAIALFCVLLIVAATLWALRQPGPNDAASADSAMTANPVHGVIGPFVERGEWSDRRIAALNVALLELGQPQIAAVAAEPWFQRFVDDLRKRFKEQQALARAPLTAQSSPLAALAVTVGLDLNSPDAAIRITGFDLPDTSAASSRIPAGAPPGQTTREQPSPPPGTMEAGAGTRLPEASRTSAAIESEASPTPSTGAATVSRQSTCRVELIRSRRPLCHDTLASGESGPQLALIPAGEFDMGSTAAATEQPVRRVRIQKPFAMSVHEVSQAEFRLYCEDTGRACPAQPWSGDDYPVVNVSWQEARGYAEWLSRGTGYRYRLPSESHWEYAARAGESGLVPGGDALSPTDAHYSMLTRLPAPARRSQKFNHNAFRLMHTLGNVREWADDAWTGDLTAAPLDGAAVRSSPDGMRVARGGSYVDNTTKLRLSMREGLPADTRDALTGFRVMREVP